MGEVVLGLVRVRGKGRVRARVRVRVRVRVRARVSSRSMPVILPASDGQRGSG